MKDWALRRRCRRLLRELDIQPPLQVKELCEQLGRQRGRPINLAPFPLPVPGPFGLWIAAADADHIVYQQETSPFHQDHIILHEIGHILAEHRSDDHDEEFWLSMMPDLSPEAVRRALRRSSYDTAHEREAELVATLILEWAAVLNRVSPTRASNAAVQRFQSALGDRRGWL
ncbi:hypothetical protein GCM10012275_59940 [Longimycelium tulufanense]|uniref:IrrE N-terminal-like domain-containing protein n=1 Tax=Longimycelium tulufanense TaxID=907463 RepID=A0A8J3CL62_9PSEU|nr:hypothetical protein [Longimycelium tulufanense]GGM81306.1 hypothetical protein GCM10012275_59940 [Longimycelium tulufanense]